jgi:hypothetical protein
LHDNIKIPCQAKQPLSASFQGVALVTHTSEKMLTIFSIEDLRGLRSERTSLLSHPVALWRQPVRRTFPCGDRR